MLCASWFLESTPGKDSVARSSCSHGVQGQTGGQQLLWGGRSDRTKLSTNLCFPFYLVLQCRGAVWNSLSGSLERELNGRVTVCLRSESPSHPSVMRFLLLFAQEVKIQWGKRKECLGLQRQLKSSNPVWCVLFACKARGLTDRRVITAMCILWLGL